MKKLKLTFKYSLPPGLRKKKIPDGAKIPTYPFIPVVFYSKTEKQVQLKLYLIQGQI